MMNPRDIAGYAEEEEEETPLSSWACCQSTHATKNGYFNDPPLGLADRVSASGWPSVRVR